MANENLIVFPNGRKLSEFALSGSGGSITGSGINNSLTAWTGQNTLIAAANGTYTISDASISAVNYIEGISGANSLRLFAFNATDPAATVQASKFRIGYDCHIGSNSGFLRDNAGTVEMHLTSGKKFSIIWG